MGEVRAKNKLNLFINRVDATIYELISETFVNNGAIYHLANTYARVQVNLCKVCFENI